MLDLKLPSEEKLAALCRELDWRYPDSYLQFIRSRDVRTFKALKNGVPDGWFVRSVADICEFENAEMTKGELAIFLVKGNRQHMSNITPYGAPQELDFYGFDLRRDLYPDLKESPVVVFSIHAVIGGWCSFPEFVDYLEDKTGWAAGRYGFLGRPGRM